MRIVPVLGVLGLALPLVVATSPSTGPPAGPRIATAQGQPHVPAGFAVTPYAETASVLTSLAFGPDTRGGNDPRLYATDFARGRVVAIDDTAGVGLVSTFADGFSSPLGVVVAGDGTVFVADSEGPREGPFGERTYGRVWRVRDTDGDGTGDEREIVLRDLPNGRHNTNNLVLGPDGALYVPNGNSTDDGVEGGDPEAPPWSGSLLRVDPTFTDVSLADLEPADVLVATGMRNLYDVAVSPFDANRVYITMNGADDARKNDSPPPDDPEPSDDLLYLTEVDDTRPAGRDQPQADAGRGRKAGFVPTVDDFGFPSCLYNVDRQGDLEPYDNPNPDVIAEFGACPVEEVPRPIASFGLHPSSDGAAFQTTDAWGEEFVNDLFVAEFGNFFGDEIVGHRVVRVQLDATGESVTEISGFLSGVFPLDVTFGPEGAMYVADFSGHILRVDRL